jgi:tetratricopeptide (TPR) repeat protein
MKSKGWIAALFLLGTVMAGWATETPPAVAVLDSPEAGVISVGLADFIEAGLQREGVPTFDRRYVQFWLAERNLGRSGLMDFKTLQQARLPGMEFFVRSEAQAIGTNRFALTLEAVRASDAVITAAFHEEGRYPQEWLPTLERLIREMGVKLRQAQTAAGKVSPGHAITWMPEASLWFFQGLDCFANGDAAQAVIAFRQARRWDEQFRLAWLWEARSYQRLGLAAPAQRVLEAAHLSEKPIGKAGRDPVFAVVAGNGITPEEKQELERALSGNGGLAVLDPRWIGASAREVDLQLTGQMTARTTAGNVWLMVDHLIFLEKTSGANPKYQARQQNVLTGKVENQAETGVGTNSLEQLAQKLSNQSRRASGAAEKISDAPKNSRAAFSLSVSPGEAELARCLERVARDPADVRTLLAAADACQTWESEVILNRANDQRERGVEWRVREEFLTQAIAAIRRNPSQKDASFLLASALWRQRHTPEYGIWAGSFSGTPLREQMQPLLELFSTSADATNLAETITENAVHNHRSVPTDPRYLQPAIKLETAVVVPSEIPSEPPDAEEKRQAFISLFYQNQMDQAAVLFSQLARAHVRLPYYETERFLQTMLQRTPAPENFISDLESIIETPDVPDETRFLAAYKLAMHDYEQADYFRASELLRNLVADEASARMIVARGGSNGSTSIRDQAYDLLKHLRLVGDGELDFRLCGGKPQPVAAADPAALDALEKLFQERMALTLSVGRPTPEKLDQTRKEMRQVEAAMFNQYRAALPAFFQHKIKESGPGPETMGLCAQLGTNALPLLPEIVSGVFQQGNRSTQCNALWALGNMGQSAARALPVVILALESDDATMVRPAASRALKKLGVAPHQAMPYLARLLYHADAVVALNAANAVMSSAALPADFRAGLDDDEFVRKIQTWWENTGSWQAWK